MMAGSRVLLELGPDTYGTFGSGIYGAGIFGVGGEGDEVDVTGPARSISVVRVLGLDGVTDGIQPATCSVVLSDPALNPKTNEHTRPGRPLRVYAELVDEDDAVTREPVFSGTIRRAALGVDRDGTLVINLTATDAVTELAKAPVLEAAGGTFGQRVTAALEGTGIPYAVTDNAELEAPSTLPTNATTALGQLKLARDTCHGYVFVDRAGVVQAVAENARGLPAPVAVLTDGSIAGLAYTHLEPGFDTEEIVNVLEVELVDEAGTVVETFVDEDSRDTWGASSSKVTINEGEPSEHALRFFAVRSEPDLIPKRVQFNATKLDALQETAGLELYDVVQVVRDGLLDEELQVVGLEHRINPRRTAAAERWLTVVTLRRPDVVPLRWDDFPPAFTWDDFPAGLTWDDLINWRPTP